MDIKQVLRGIKNWIESNYYDKGAVDQLIEAISSVNCYEVYSELPNEGQGNVIYLIGPSGSGADKYEEYIYSNSEFIKIGDTSVDLSGYVTSGELETALGNIDLSGYLQSSDIAAWAKAENKPSYSYSEISNTPTIPTNVSDLNNDAGYLTSHQDISGKQDVISDLNSIRSNAASGSAAYSELFITPVSFGGLQIASGPLAYENGEYVIKDGWNYSSYDSNFGKNDGSTYFSFEEMGQLFEKADFSKSDGSIENLLDPLDGWRLPTKEELESIVGTEREGSTVNGLANKHYAIVGLEHSDDILVGYGTRGLIIFPDGATITGKALPGMDSTTITDNITKDDIDAYVNQGCAFFPACGYHYSEEYYSVDTWDDSGDVGVFLSSTSGEAGEYYQLYFDGGYITVTESNTISGQQCSVQLVKSATPISKLDEIETLLASI